MKNTLVIGIASARDIKARSLAIARGMLKPSANDPKVWFPSLRAAGQIFSPENKELLRVIAERHPSSIAELAKLTDRQPSNVSRTLKRFEKIGVVRFEERERGKKAPVTRYTGYHVYDTWLSPTEARV